MSSEYEWLTLDADEEVLWSSRAHRYSLYTNLAAGVVLLVFLVGVFVIVGSWLTYRNTNYVVTTKRIYAKRGILSRNVQTVDFGKVQNINYTQTALGTQFGYGNVEISTAGSSGAEITFRSIPDPADVQELIDREIKDDGDGSREDAEGTDDVLDDVLEELRAIRHLLEEQGRQESGLSEDRQSTPSEGDRTPGGDGL